MTEPFSTTPYYPRKYHYLWLLPSVLLVVVVVAWVSTSVSLSYRASSCSSYDPQALKHHSQGNLKDAMIQDLNNTAEMFHENHDQHNITRHSGAYGFCECPPPFEPVLHQCYYANPIHRLNWETAARFCRGMGGHLARPIYVAALIAFLLQHHPTVMEWYLGGSDQTEEGVWQWTDGRPVSEEDWLSGEPNGSTRENCLILCFEMCEEGMTSTLPFPALNDEHCGGLFNFVCEYSKSDCAEIW